jgi:hypothetical protein
MRSNPETRERWQQHIEGFKSSGLTRKEYCEKNQINVSTFDYWREKLNPSGKRKQVNAGWIPVKIADDSGPGIDIRIGKINILVKPGFNRSLLIELLQTIASC